MRVALLCNDIPPGFGVPVAAPGIRAWSLASGLRSHGVDARLVVPTHALSRVFGNRTGFSPPRGCDVVKSRDVSAFLEAQRFHAVVLTNFNQVGALRGVSGAAVVYDMFAPRLLELLATQLPRNQLRKKLAEMWARKAEALRLASLVIVNGAKKLAYCQRLVSLATGSQDTKTVVVPMGLPAHGDAGSSRPPPASEVSLPARSRVLMAGYLQGWSLPGPWVKDAVSEIKDNNGILEIIAPEHWAQGGTLERPEILREVGASDSVLFSRPTTLSSLLVRTRESRVVLDLFAESLERKYAMVTRTVTALAVGVPAIHPPFTEISPLLRQYDAGWLVDPDDTEGLRRAIRAALSDEELVNQKARNAALLSREVLSPEVATSEFVKHLWYLI